MLVRTILLVGLVVAPLITGYCQPEADSLQQRITAEEDDTLKVLMLNRLSELRVFSNTQQAIELARDASRIAGEIGYQRGVILSTHRLGTATWSKGDLLPALSMLNQSLAMAEKARLPDLIALNVGRMGLIYAASGIYTTANQYYRRAIPLFKEAGNMDQIHITYNNLGKSFLELNDLDSAEVYLTRAKRIKEENHLAERPIVLFNLAELYFKRGKFQLSEQYLERTLKGALRSNDRRAQARYFQLRAELSLRRQDIPRAYGQSLRAVQLADSVGSKELQYITYRTHAGVLQQYKREAEAYDYLIRYGQYRDSLQSLQLRNLLTLQDYDNTQREIQLLQSREHAAEAESRERLVIILALAAVLVVAVILAISFNSQHRKRKAMHDQLQVKNADIVSKAIQLTNANQFKSRILTMIAHDVRSPLATAKSMLDLAMADMVTERELKEFVPELSTKIDRVLELTNTLLAWANLKFKDASSVSTSFNLSDLINQRLSYYAGVAAQKDVVIHNSMAALIVCADKDLIDMVFRNLLTNAIKFSPSNSQISISARLTGTELEVSVSDQGTGMSQDAAARLFGHSVKSTDGTSGEKGSGLGLLLCKELLEQFNGRIWIATTSAQGTTMAFAVPTC
ncbi:MAG: tetratricopeptide repeat protein [Cyclobacteriaceae bacterium]|nr:tetratricopeptide repeat protein [Cyclobacteriaceae bacterium]